MKTILKAIALSGAMVIPVLAQSTNAPATTAPTDSKDQKDLKKVIEDQGINYVETAQKGITLSGYVDASYTEQFAGRGTPFGGSNQSDLHEFDHNNDNFNVDAIKIALEKALPDKNEWAAGFRIDTIYGEDAAYLGDTAFNGAATKSTGTVNDSGLAIEQALVKFRIPVGNGLDIYAGKFVTFLGYEVIESPANPNFSRGLLFTNLIPLTNTGVYADYKFNDTFEAKLGVVDGSNNSVSTPSADPAASYAFGGKELTGQLNINAPGKNANITQSFIYAPDSAGGTGTYTPDNGTQVVYDIWGNWNPTFDKAGNTTLGFNVDFGYNSQSGYAAGQTLADGYVVPAGGLHDSNTWFGVALYSIYKFNKVFSLAGRAEYIHSDAAYNPQFGPGAGAELTNPTTGAPLVSPSQDDFSYTLTASFNIWDNLLTRVEYRIDDLSGSSTINSAGYYGTATQIQNEISLEAVYSF